MKKSITTFSEFKRVVKRNLSKHVDLYYTKYGFYYRTNKCTFFYSCRSIIDRNQVFEFIRENCIKHYELDVLYD